MHAPNHPGIPMGGHRRLSPQQIVRLEADRNYTCIYQANGQRLLVATTLKIIEERLRPYGFARITRGDVINPEFIQKIWKDGCVQLTDGTRIAPSRRRKGVLQQSVEGTGHYPTQSDPSYLTRQPADS